MDTACYDEHLKLFSITGDWALYSLTWEELHQAGWGTPVDFDPTILTELNFTGIPNDASVHTVDFWVDNPGFFKDQPPEDPP